jgi:hypothetical protein
MGCAVDGARFAAAPRHLESFVDLKDIRRRILTPGSSATLPLLPLSASAPDPETSGFGTALMLFYFSHLQKLHYNAVSSKNAHSVCIIMQFPTTKNRLTT